jgi:transcription initiation factor TFIIIB Brf1 subunit/transcription initiation factor TFIIB
VNCEDCGAEIDGNVCKECGLVIDDHPIHFRPISIDRDDERKEPEKPLSLIKWDDPDISLKTYHSSKTKNKRLKWAFKTEKKTQPKLLFGKMYLNAKNEIERICGNMKLSKVISDNAIYYLRKLVIKGHIDRSYKKYALYVALIIISARFFARLPMSFAEFSEHTNESIKSIKTVYKKLLKKLEIAPNPFYLEEVVLYHCNKLGLTFKETERCLKLARKVKTVSGRIPDGYSAAIIRIETHMKRMDLSRILKVSEPIITARERELRKL